jgi:hypothetical protein
LLVKHKIDGRDGGFCFLQRAAPALQRSGNTSSPHQRGLDLATEAERYWVADGIFRCAFRGAAHPAESDKPISLMSGGAIFQGPTKIVISIILAP